MAQIPKGGEVYHADDGTVSIVLEDNYDPNYEPPEKEIEEYAKWLGIDVETERDLFWIARDGLKAPLPKEWKPCKTDTGEVYYFNFKTGDSIWEHPMDEVYKARVEDERRKLRAGGGKEKKEKKSKAEKEKVPEKGSAGFSAAPATSGSGGGKQQPLADLKPTTTRLGSLGEGGGGGSSLARPDISDLVRKDAGASGGGGSGNGGAGGAGGLGGSSLGTNPAEAERKLRDKYTAEFEAMQKALREQHDREVEHNRKLKKAERDKAELDIDRQVREAVEDAKRAAERRRDRELQLYESSIEKQKEDLRRTLQQLRQRFETESAAVNRRVEKDLEDKRKQSEAAVAERVQQYRTQRHNEWREEMTRAELRTEAQIREMQNAHQLAVDAARQRESQAVSQRLAELEDRNVRETESLRQELRERQQRHADELRASASRGSGSGAGAEASPEYVQAEREYQAALAAARDEAAADLLRVRAELDASRNQLAVEFEAEKRRVQDEIGAALDAARAAGAASAERSAAELLQSYRDASRAKVQAHQRHLDADERAALEAFERETESLVQAAREAQLAKEASLSSDAAQRQRLRNELEESHRTQLAQRRAAAATRVEEIKAAVAKSIEAARDNAKEKSAELLREMIEAWEKANPPPPLPSAPTVLQPPTVAPSASTGADAAAAAVASAISAALAAVEKELAEERARAAAENAQKLDALRKQLDESQRKSVEDHRRKAMQEIEERLNTYSLERSCSPLVGTPSKAEGATRHSNHIDERAASQRVAEAVEPLRMSLQKNIDALSDQIQALRASHAQKLAEMALRNAQELQAIAASGGAASRATQQQPAQQQHAQQQHHHHHHPQSANSSGEGPIPHLRASTPNWISGLASSYPAHGGGARNEPAPTSAVPHVAATSSRADRRYEERLAKAGELLKRKKRELRQRQEDLERARADWKRDFAEAKASSDAELQRILSKVRNELEAKAKRLNQEALQVRETSAWLKEEEARFRARAQEEMMAVAAQAASSGHLLRSGRQAGRPSSAPMQFTDPVDVMSVLNLIAEKVNVVENRVMRMQQPVAMGQGQAAAGAKPADVMQWVMGTDVVRM